MFRNHLRINHGSHVFREEMILLINISLKVIYINRSGSLQPSDIFFLLGMGALVLRNRGRILLREKENAAVFFFLLMVYQFLVNGIWAIALSDFKLLKPCLFYLFNFFAFILTVGITRKYGSFRVKRAISMGAILSEVISIVGILGGGITVEARGSGFFNNPNQLGYHGLICLTILILCADALNKTERMAMLLLSVYCVLSSASRGAIIGSLFLMFVQLLYRTKWNPKSVMMGVVFCVLLIVFVHIVLYSDIDFIASNPQIVMLRYRIMNLFAGESSNLSDGRGYGRIFEMGRNYLWGMGEGAYYRFEHLTNFELHSTLVSLFVSYGIIGFCGYLALFKMCMGNGRQFINNLCLLSGVLLYTITHNSIRTTLTWIVLGLIYVINQEKEKGKRT